MTAMINDVPINYIDLGNPSGMPVLFVHGFPFSHAMWKRQLNEVSQLYRAIAYDVRGHGESYVGDGQYTIEAHVEDLISLMDYLKIEKSVIVGLSMGGYIALRALERSPGRFLAAVLCDTRSEADTNENKLKRAEGIKGVKRDGSALFADAFVKGVFTSDTFRQNPEVVEEIRTIIARTTPLGIAGTLLALASRTDTTASLSSIRIPTLILVGEQDATTPPSASQSMHARIPGSEIHLIPRAAHMSNLENPEVFSKQLLTFLKRVSSSPR